MSKKKKKLYLHQNIFERFFSISNFLQRHIIHLSVVIEFFLVSKDITINLNIVKVTSCRHRIVISHVFR